MADPQTSETRLPEAIRRLLADALDQDKLEMPYLPGTAAEIMQLCQNEEVEARELADLVQRDQSIASHVLKTANSAAFAPKERIVSLQQAISRLGIGMLKEIALGMTLKGNVFEVPGYGVKIRNMWMHSAAAAQYAKEVARRLRKNVEGSFLVGLLHDAGKPIVMQNLVRLAREKTDKPIPPVIMELAMAEFHEDVGSRMVEAWKMPEWMSVCVRHHHHYEQAGDYRDETMIVHLADHFAHWALNDQLSDEDFPSEIQVAWDLNLYAEDIVDLLALRGQILETTELFG